MNAPDLLSEYALVLRARLAEPIRWELKQYVDACIAGGDFRAGFDCAVKAGELTVEEVEELLATLIATAPTAYIGVDQVAAFIRQHQIPGCRRDFIIVAVDDVVVSDGLHLHRCSRGRQLWSTKRVSWDGIHDLRVVGDGVIGVGCDLRSYDGEYISCPFRVALVDGRIIDGRVIDGRVIDELSLESTSTDMRASSPTLGRRFVAVIRRWLGRGR